MNRGSASFTTMKGFMGDFVAKGDGHEEETLPLDTGADITETAELDDAQVNAPKAANIKKSDNKPGDPTTTMSEEVKEVEAGAEEDIADSYVSDVQHLPGPGDRVKKGLGYEDFNNMVAKGHVVQVSSGMNVHNVHDTMGLVQKAAMEDFDLLAREASPYTMKGMQDLSYDGGFEDLTVGKGLSSLVYKGDTEDMSLEDGYTEDSDSTPEYTEESDDDKEIQGMNEPSPQTSESEAKADAASGAENPEEAETEDEEPIEDEASSDNTTDALGKGWMAYERNFVGKGFVVEQKGGWKYGKDGKVLGPVNKPNPSGGSVTDVSPDTKSRLKVNPAKDVTPGKLANAWKWIKGKKVPIAAGAGGAALLGAGIYAGSRGSNKKGKGFGYLDYERGIATKGFSVEMKGSGGFLDLMEFKIAPGKEAQKEINRSLGEFSKTGGRSGASVQSTQYDKRSGGYTPTKDASPEDMKKTPTRTAANQSQINALTAASDSSPAKAAKEGKPSWWKRAGEGIKNASKNKYVRYGAAGAGGAALLGGGYLASRALSSDKGVDDQGIVVKSVGGVKKKTSRVLYR